MTVSKRPCPSELAAEQPSSDLNPVSYCACINLFKEHNFALCIRDIDRCKTACGGRVAPV